MSLTKQNIVDAYNSVYSLDNDNILKTYEQLSYEEKFESLLILLNNNGISGGSGSGITQEELEDGILNVIQREEIPDPGYTNKSILFYLKYLTNIGTNFSLLIPSSPSGQIDLIPTIKGFWATFGTTNDPIAPSATGNSTLIGLIKFLNNAVSFIQGNQLGVSSDAAPTNDTVNNLLAGLRRIIQKIPTLVNGRIPTETLQYRPNTVATPILETVINLTDVVSTKSSLGGRTRIAISNTGSNSIYCDVTVNLTTTKYLFTIEPGDLYIDDFHTGVYYFRCATGLTSTLQIREWQ